MSDVININDLKNQATQVIKIPNFNNDGVISIRVKKPQIMKLVMSGKLPNPLMSKALQILDGGMSQKEIDSMDKEGLALEGIKNVELYCRACMVEPTFEEANEYLTDDQRFAIFLWATKDVLAVSSFRDEQEDDTDNYDGEDVPETTERDTTDQR